MSFLTIRVVALALLSAAVLARAQEPVVVCENGDVNRCYPVTQAVEAPAMSRPYAQNPASSTWSHDGMVGVDTNEPPPAALENLPQAPLEPIQAWLEWKPGYVVEDPLYKEAGTCSYTPARARGRFARAVREQNLNALLATYHWRGKTDAQATVIIDRLSRVGIHGQWEASTVGMWTGPAGVRAKVKTHWRWAGDEAQMHLAMRQVDQCWFVELTSSPGEMIEIPVDQFQHPEALPGQPSPPAEPQRDPNNPDVLVF